LLHAFGGFVLEENCGSILRIRFSTYEASIAARSRQIMARFFLSLNTIKRLHYSFFGQSHETKRGNLEAMSWVSLCEILGLRNICEQIGRVESLSLLVTVKIWENGRIEFVLGELLKLIFCNYFVYLYKQLMIYSLLQP